MDTLESSTKNKTNIRLEELDLSKHGGFGGGIVRKDLENTLNHPDLNNKDNFLCQIDGDFFAGKFLKTWYGWNFRGWITPAGLQYDKPGTNGSRW